MPAAINPFWYTESMRSMQFTVEINASRRRIWDTLWQDATFREWAGIIDPGTYMAGDLVEGNEVQFISAENGYGVTSKVETLVENEFLLLRHKADTQNTGEETRDDEWTGGEESYALTDANGAMTLTVVFDVPSELEDYFNENYPKALQRVKALAESVIE